MSTPQSNFNYNREKLTADVLVNFFSQACNENPFLLKGIDRPSFAAKLAEKAEFIVCRTSLKKITGLIAFYKNNGIFVYISFVCVLKSFQNNSIFSKMLLALELYAKENNYKRIQLEVASGNTIAQQVYQHKGFSLISKNSNSFHLEKNLTTD